MTRLVLQSEAAECGLACLVMVAASHGLVTDLADLRRRFPLSLKGATLGQLMACARSMGLAGRPLRLDLEELRELARPCILHWDLNHFVVLVKASRSHVVVLDPAVGERRLTLQQASSHFTGVALELSPTADFEPKRLAPRLKLGSLTGRVRGLKRSLAQIFAVALVLELFAIAMPQASQLVVDDVLVSGDRELLTVVVLGFGLLMLCQTAIIEPASMNLHQAAYRTGSCSK